VDINDQKVVMSASEKNRARGQEALRASSVLQNIQNLKQAASTAQGNLDDAVIRARADGYSWVAIAAGLGVSPQGARQKYLRVTA
jgi:multidrug resistance efflux pump